LNCPVALQLVMRPIIGAGVKWVTQNCPSPAPHECSLSLCNPMGSCVRTLYQPGKYRYPAPISFRMGPIV